MSFHIEFVNPAENLVCDCRPDDSPRFTGSERGSRTVKVERRRQKRNRSPPLMASFDMETLSGWGAGYPEKKARRKDWFDEFFLSFVVGSRILRSGVMGNGFIEARRARLFCDGVGYLCSRLGCGRQRLHVPELSEKRVLVVVATARYDAALLVEAGDFTERHRHLAPGGRQRTERSIVGTFDFEYRDNRITCVNILALIFLCSQHSQEPKVSNPKRRSYVVRGDCTLPFQ
jgi:hypothetical protein